MQTIKAYLYPNTAEVQFLDPTVFSVRGRTVYSRPIKVYQGIDNPIQFIAKNQEQRSYNLTGYEVQVDIQDPVNQVTIDSTIVTFSNIASGQGSFVISKNTVNNLEQRFYKLTFRTIKLADNSETPMYIDDNFGVPLDLQILPAYYATTVSGGGIGDGTIDLGTL